MSQQYNLSCHKTLKAIRLYTYVFGYYSCYHMKLKRFGKLLHSGHLKLSHPMAVNNHKPQLNSLSSRMSLKGYRYYRYVFGWYSCCHMQHLSFGRLSCFGCG